MNKNHCPNSEENSTLDLAYVNHDEDVFYEIDGLLGKIHSVNEENEDVS